jgi:predicted DNA-binding transcriptional regulator AlpA
MNADELVGIEEIARTLAVTRQRAYELTFRADFPPPVEPRSGHVWRRRDIDSWAHDTRQVSPSRRFSASR